MVDPHTREGQVERAKRLRAHIEDLKAGKQVPDSPEHKKSLREQIEERANEAHEQEQGNE